MNSDAACRGLILPVAFLAPLVLVGCLFNTPLASLSPAAPGPSATSPQQTTGAAASSPARNGFGSLKPRYQSRPLIDGILFGPAASAKEGNWNLPVNTEDVTITSADGTKLHGRLSTVKNPRHVILFTHGNGGNVAYCSGILRTLQTKFHATCLAFDYRGYGRSEGKPTLEGVVADAKAARSFLAKRVGIAPEEIVLWGHSMGGAIAVQLAKTQSPKALILDSTFSSLRDEANHVAPKLAWMVKRSLWNSAADIKEYRGPLFVMHGDSDRVIPWQQGKALYEAANDPRRFVRLRGGRHNSSLSHPQAGAALTEFLQTIP